MESSTYAIGMRVTRYAQAIMPCFHGRAPYRMPIVLRMVMSRYLFLIALDSGFLACGLAAAADLDQFIGSRRSRSVAAACQP